jgi:hypothetical protein
VFQIEDRVLSVFRAERGKIARTGVVVRRVLLRVDAIYGAGIDAGYGVPKTFAIEGRQAVELQRSKKANDGLQGCARPPIGRMAAAETICLTLTQ